MSSNSFRLDPAHARMMGGVRRRGLQHSAWT